MGLNGNNSPIMLEAIPEASITVMRPYRSESTLAGMIDTANIPVVNETVNAAVAGVIRYDADNAGSRACVQYIAAKLARPAPYSAAVMRRYPGIPTRCATTTWAIAMMLSAEAPKRKGIIL
ncbi:hypothetical protein MMAN_25720 [Mycobacterium mantenii]|uniref:Uncharacterized protein n=1 Tax=Mycobacterium mantenii TaxID=560555 RepID=A0ABM7JSB0_MYCNT|nr:hypothetical protein MMAN_25720 [Mycobacterium mantenii]